MSDYVVAIDQGTTSSRAIIFDKSGSIVSSGQLEHEQIFPQAGWVEHNPVEIICYWVAAAMDAGEIPAANATLVAGAIIGIIVQNATFKLYGRLDRGLAEVTEQRLGYITTLFRQLGFPQTRARRRALFAYSAYLGQLQLLRSDPDLLAKPGPASAAHADDILATLLAEQPVIQPNSAPT